MLVRTDVPQPPRTFATRTDAWDYLKHLLHLVVALFGAPERLARLGGVSRCFRAEINDWLRPMERLARLLLLAEAAAFVRIAPRKPIAGQRTYHFPRADVSHNDPTKWRVSFAVLRANRKAGSGSKGYSIPTILPQGLAARIEALARVALDPTPYARRLARRLDRAPNPRAVRALLAPVRTAAGSLMRIIDMAAPLIGAIRFRFSSA